MQSPAKSRQRIFIVGATLLACVLASACIGWRLRYEAQSGRPGEVGDTHYYMVWGQQAQEVGLFNVYSIDREQSISRWGEHQMNYGPAFAYYVLAQAELRHAIWGHDAHAEPGALVLLLIPESVCYVLVGLMLIALLRPRVGQGRAIIAGLLYWLSPGIPANSAYHGQTDAMICLVMLVSLWGALGGRWLLVGAVWMLGVLIKPQPLLIVPILGYVLLRRGSRGDLVRLLAGAAGVLLVVVGPFVLANGPVAERFAWARQTYYESFRIWNSTTNKAYNLWWLDRVITGATDPNQRLLGLDRSLWGLVLLAAATVEAMVNLRHYRRVDTVMSASGAAIIAVAAFLFPTRAWDRYLVYGLVLMIPLAMTNRAVLAAYVAMGLAWAVNLHHGNLVSWEAAGVSIPPVWLIGTVCAAIHLTGFAVLVWQVSRLSRNPAGRMLAAEWRRREVATSAGGAGEK